MYFIVFACGMGLAVAGFYHQNHTVVVESFGLPMITGSLAYWAMESKHFLNESKDKNKKN